MNIETQNIDTLTDALAELDELLKVQPEAISRLLVDLLGQANAYQLTLNTYNVLQWLSERLQEITDAAEAFDVLVALTEIAVDFFRFLSEGIQAMTSHYDPSIDIPGLDELRGLFQSGGSVADVLEALGWLPDPVTTALLQQQIQNLVAPPTGGLYLVMENITA